MAPVQMIPIANILFQKVAVRINLLHVVSLSSPVSLVSKHLIADFKCNGGPCAPLKHLGERLKLNPYCVCVCACVRACVRACVQTGKRH